MKKLTVELSDTQKAKLDETCNRAEVSVAQFVEFAIDKAINDPFTRIEALREFLKQSVREAKTLGFEISIYEIASRICLDWIAGASVESCEFGKSTTRFPVMTAISLSPDEFFREMLSRYRKLISGAKTLRQTEEMPQ